MPPKYIRNTHNVHATDDRNAIQRGQLRQDGYSQEDGCVRCGCDRRIAQVRLNLQPESKERPIGVGGVRGDEDLAEDRVHGVSKENSDTDASVRCTCADNKEREGIDPVLGDMLTSFYPIHKTQNDFNQSCHLTKNFKCAKGFGPGGGYCQREGDRCVTVKGKDQQNARRRAMHDPIRQNYVYWEKSSHS